MKRAKSDLMLVSILVMFGLLGFAVLYRMGFVPKGLDLLIFALILIGGIYAFVTSMKKHKDVQEGFPAEDEMSTLIKYKAGYYAFLSSLYMWLFIFLFNRFFPDVETMLGSGIMLSAIGSMVIKIYLTRNYHENQD